eukprot:m.81413 g.81413  ORF g.81413 m.81413 type:complete len:129 (+) comp50731_c0_seq4:637-1023(+)
MGFAYRTVMQRIMARFGSTHPSLTLVRGALFAGVLAAGFLTDSQIDRAQEYACDTAAAELSRETALGGVEVLLRQVQLNKWLFKQGASGCTPEGNNERDWQHPPATERLARVRAIVQRTQSTPPNAAL